MLQSQSNCTQLCRILNGEEKMKGHLQGLYSLLINHLRKGTTLHHARKLFIEGENDTLHHELKFYYVQSLDPESVLKPSNHSTYGVSVMYTLAKGLNQMHGGLKVSRPQTMKMILYVNVSKFFLSGNLLTFILEMMILHFSMQHFFFLEQTNTKCHLCTI